MRQTVSFLDGWAKVGWLAAFLPPGSGGPHQGENQRPARAERADLASPGRQATQEEEDGNGEPRPVVVMSTAQATVVSAKGRGFASVHQWPLKKKK